MLTQVRKAGTTDVSVIIRIVDSTDGTPETGVTSATGGLDLEYRREGATSTDITEADLTNLNDAHSDGGLKHIGNGYYRLDLPDAAVATGATGVLVHGTVTGMVVIGCYVQLVTYDPFQANGYIAGLLESGISSIGTLDAGSTTGGTLPSGQRANVRAGHWIVPKTTAGAGEGRTIDTYDAGTGVFTVSPAFDNSVSGATYYVLIAPPSAPALPFDANVTKWKGSTAPDNTGDAYARLGAPDGATVSADVLTLINELGAAAAATGVPVAGDPLAAKVAFIVAHLINKVTYNESTGVVTLRNATDSADMATRTDSVAGSVHTKGVLS